MLRAGPLSSTSILETLQRDFVNVWLLAPDLEALRDDPETAPELRTLARQLRERYRYPVDTQIVAADGRLLGQKAVNDMQSDGDYADLLRSSLARAGD